MSMPVSSFANEIWFIISLRGSPSYGVRGTRTTGGAKRPVPDGTGHEIVADAPGEERYNDGTPIGRRRA